jgi:FHS family L-fucose permease-like MFS transporter
MTTTVTEQLEPKAQSASLSMVSLVVALFFIWGFSTVLVDSLIPKLKAMFTLSYAEVMLSQFAFFLAYLIFSIPAGRILERLGYMRCIVVGLGVMAAGGLMFSPAAALGIFPLFLVALFVLASGITLLQVAANPLMANLGGGGSSSWRLTLAQAFNSLGTTVGPRVGAAIILAGALTPPDPATTTPDVMDAFRKAQAHAVQLPFVAIAAVLVVLAAIFWAVRNWSDAPPVESARSHHSSFGLLKAYPGLALGCLSIFVYVGCEVTIGSFMTNYLMQPDKLALVAAEAGKLVSFYWGGAMVGRFIGSFVLSRLPPGLVLAGCAVIASLLVVISSATGGHVSAYSLIGVGFFNSIMFPTIFSLGIAGLGKETPQASALLCTAIVGGAVIPPATGALADHLGLASALLLPAVGYIWIAFYGIRARNVAS